jgi:plastocyanin
MIFRTLIALLYLALASNFALAGTIEGKVTPGKSVVFVDAISGKSFPAPSTKRVINQKALVFTPHLLVVQQGTTVDFLNSDSVQHNVFWPSVSGDKKDRHNLGSWPKGETRSFQFNTPGVVPVLCNVHPEMSAFIIVSPTPYFAETDDAGNFKIENVPDGKYNLAAWHEGMKTQVKPVTVKGTAKLDFALAK